VSLVNVRKIGYSSFISTGSVYKELGRTKMISDFFGNTMDSVSDFFGNITDWLNDNLTTDGPWPAFLGVGIALALCFIFGL
jgi:hypothetical protein